MVAVGGAVLLYYDCTVFVGVGLVGLVGRVGRVGLVGRVQPGAAAFLFFGNRERLLFYFLSEVCRFCANVVRTIL